MKCRPFFLFLLLEGLVPALHAQDEFFDIRQFDIRGNSLLADSQVEALVSPFTGTGRSYSDVQKALAALENAYRAQGFGTVSVRVPEQEITTGVVRFEIVESVIGQVVVNGNRYFDEQNFRASLPGLKEGSAPNLKAISANVQLANENPAKEIDVTLGLGEKSGTVDAKISVKDQDPQRWMVNFDNSGTKETGRNRLGLAYQYANLMGGDESLIVAYTTSPDIWMKQPENIKVDIYSVAFHKPFYGVGDSLDVIYGNSNVNVPSAQATGFGLNGKGEMISMRWNHHFPRLGENAAKLVFGYDYKHFNTLCVNPVTGQSFPVAPPTPLNRNCVPHTTQPVSATVTGNAQGIDHQVTYSLGLAINLFPIGLNYTAPPGSPAVGRIDKYSYIANRPVDDEFAVLRGSVSYSRMVSGWQLRAGLNAQLTDSGLVPGEQIGLTGATAVRGFGERVIAADTGYIANLEAYTPNFADRFGVTGNLHGLVFLDWGYGRNVGAQGQPFDKVGIASIGAGLRYSLQKDVSVSLDIANVVDGGPVGTEERGNWRGHLRMTIGF